MGMRKSSITALGVLVPLLGGCGGGADSVAPPPVPTPHMTIDVRYLSPMTEQQRAIVAAAADKWTRALLKDLGSFQFVGPANDCFPGEPALSESHHNLLLFISVEDHDGRSREIAVTQVCGVSSRDNLPVLSHILIDKADIDTVEARGLLGVVVAHEMAHALGFNSKVYAKKGLVKGDITDPFFVGASARAEFAAHVPSYTGNPVPLENVGDLGLFSSHWRLSVFGDELMVASLAPTSRFPLSAVTLGLFADIGYKVDLAVAESYGARSVATGSGSWAVLSLANDIRATPSPRRLLPIVSR